MKSFPAKILCTAVFLFVLMPAFTQKRIYTVANAHSHNDYVNPIPFYTAYNAGFGSIEADIYLYHDRLIVGHDSADLLRNRSLEVYYIKPLDSCIRANRGTVYSQSGKQLILLIDIKNAPAANLDSLVALLKRYPAVTACQSLRISITGSRPDPELFTSFPPFIWFDGVLSKKYSAVALSRIVLFSDNLRSYVNWKGEEQLSPVDSDKLKAAIKRSHDQNRPVRFWNAPDNPYAWNELMSLDADFINTDHIAQLSAFWSSNTGSGGR